MRLESFQRSMADYLRRKLTSDPLPVGCTGKRRHEHLIEECLDIYRDHYLISLTEAIAATFPITRKQLGDADFLTRVRSYVLAHPPRSGCLADYGQDFPGWLNDGIHEKGGAVSAEGDLAALEWSLERVGMASLPAPFPFQALAELPQSQYEQVRFQVAPGVRLFSSTWDVVSAYDRLREGESPRPLPWPCSPTSERFNWLLYRNPKGVGVFPADAFKTCIIQVCQAGKPLSVLGDTLVTEHLEALFSLVRKGLIDAFKE